MLHEASSVLSSLQSWLSLNSALHLLECHYAMRSTTLQIMTDLQAPEPQLPDKFKEQHCHEAAELVLSMTSSNPMERPSAKEILEGKLKSYIRKIKQKKRKKSMSQT